MTVFLSPRARADLTDIWAWIAVDDPRAADQNLAQLRQVFERLATMPEMGRARPELLLRLRSFPSGRHVVFYRAIEEGVEIVRVLHGSRDISALF